MKKIFLFLYILTAVNTVKAQLNPSGSMYFQNRYLANPAMAGIAPGIELNGAYKAQWTATENAPVIAAFTATYGSEEKKVGLGLSVFSDKAGVLQELQAKLSYAYHFQLNSEETYLDFGVSAGIKDGRIDFSKVNADPDDASLYDFKDREVYVDGDFGFAFRKKRLTIEGVLPNLKRLLKRDLFYNVADRTTYLASVSYKFGNSEQVISAIEPRLVYRGVENYGDIIDVALNLEFFSNKLVMSSIYHSSDSFTFGIGTTYKNSLSILTQYSTNTAVLKNSTNGEFEIALKFNFSGNR